MSKARLRLLLPGAGRLDLPELVPSRPFVKSHPVVAQQVRGVQVHCGWGMLRILTLLLAEKTTYMQTTLGVLEYRNACIHNTYMRCSATTTTGKDNPNIQLQTRAWLVISRF